MMLVGLRRLIIGGPAALIHEDFGDQSDLWVLIIQKI